MTTLDGSWLTALIDGVVGLMDLIGAPGAGVAIALENLFPPLPSEVILPMAGLAAAAGALVWFTVTRVRRLRRGAVDTDPA